ncbi:class I SAM-dependent methyltransferase [Spongiibacter pelagi]|uniref:class I SAM-dependent methyltransferase n=1 Tax=Spongiibacter pelagi TaxID=2760804 RepID=UPI001CC261E9|nr:methyltransferase domain-containing protein [Spongiibacter pelagi]
MVKSALSSHYREYYGVTTLLASHPALRRANRHAQFQLHGNKVWAASYLMMAYLQDNPLEHNSKVLEVGCGAGLAGIYCAKHFNAEVTASDGDPAVLPALELHTDANKVALNWQPALFSELTETELGQYDTLMACDICFWDDMAEDLAELIDRAIAAGVARIIIADPMRPPFLALAEYCIERHFAELLPIRAESGRRHKGAILLIENN